MTDTPTLQKFFTDHPAAMILPVDFVMAGIDHAGKFLASLNHAFVVEYYEEGRKIPGVKLLNYFTGHSNEVHRLLEAAMLRQT